MNTRQHRAREVERRQQAAAKAVATRRRRRDNRIAQIAELLICGQSLGPFPKCRICGRRLTDQASIDQAIGSECVQDVETAIEARRAA